MKNKPFGGLLISSLCLPVAFLFGSSCLAQGVATTNSLNAETVSDEFHPAIRGLGSNDVVSARQIGGGIVFLCKSSGQAIISHSTNDVCLFKGKLYTVSPNGPAQAVYLRISQPFGTNEFSSLRAMAFNARAARDHYLPSSSHAKSIDLKPILQTEYETSHSAMGTPLHHAELVVENGKLTLLFESYTHIKGKVVLDDQLNPISMAVTSTPPSR